MDTVWSNIPVVNDAEEWELEADVKEILPNARPETEIRSWEDLRANIKQELKKKAKTLPLKDRPAYDFATLRIKGYGKIARG